MTTLQLMCNGATGTVRRETFEGREYLVAPVIAIRTGVLNGELVPEDEASRHVEAWNGRPWVVDHPEINGVAVSANDPAILERQRIGYVFGAYWDNDRLKAEVWTDIEKAGEVPGGQKVLQRLESGDPLEVSTAYFRDLDETPGDFNGNAYTGIARNLKPDHLAALPDATGACSWADGCGAPRVNKEQDMETNPEATPPDQPGDDSIENESFLSKVVRAMKQALRSHKTEEARMSKIDKILENEALALVANKDALAELDEEQLDALLALAEQPENETPSEDPVENADGDMPPEDDETPEENEITKLIRSLVSRIDALEAAQAVNANADKRALVDELVENEKLGMSAEQLDKLDVPALEKLRAAVRPNYFTGQAAGRQKSGGSIKPMKQRSVLLRKEDN